MTLMLWIVVERMVRRAWRSDRSLLSRILMGGLLIAALAIAPLISRETVPYWPKGPFFSEDILMLVTYARLMSLAQHKRRDACRYSMASLSFDNETLSLCPHLSY